MDLGIYTFAELTPDPRTGQVVSAAQRRDLVEEIELADQVGLDVFGVGEHHRPDFAVSTPAVVLAAAAERTSKIRLTSAVSVISSDDPVRVFQDFATLDLLSGGRAEIMAGRGSFIESFPLFGYDPQRLRRAVRREARPAAACARLGARHLVEHARPLRDLPVYPRPVQELLPIWVAVKAVVRNRPFARPARPSDGSGNHRWSSRAVCAYADLHRRAAPRAGHEPPALGINSGFIAETSRQAADEAFAPFATMMDKIGRERGWAAMTRQDFDASTTLRGANFVGSPQDVIEKILFQHEIFRHQRFLLQLSVGTMPHGASCAR